MIFPAAKQAISTGLASFKQKVVKYEAAGKIVSVIISTVTSALAGVLAGGGSGVSSNAINWTILGLNAAEVIIVGVLFGVLQIKGADGLQGSDLDAAVAAVNQAQADAVNNAKAETLQAVHDGNLAVV